MPILTSAHIGNTTFHDELETIQEEDYISSAIDSSMIAEHSTFIPSAGELASTVIIPIQVICVTSPCTVSQGNPQLVDRNPQLNFCV